uniref:Uncharacterized protein n=1 Tax=Aegilops tauschii subsp. strangulata TaxID=200361 RepID=A0A453DR48_AEGTS
MRPLEEHRGGQPMRGGGGKLPDLACLARGRWRWCIRTCKLYIFPLQSRGKMLLKIESKYLFSSCIEHMKAKRQCTGNVLIIAMH